MLSKASRILINAVPIVLMIGLIPLVLNDYLLAAIYLAVIIAALFIHRENGDMRVFAVGFIVMIVSECFFVSTGVETFNRRTLFGLMPIWLPFLWGYGFIAIKRLIKVLND